MPNHGKLPKIDNEAYMRGLWFTTLGFFTQSSKYFLTSCVVFEAIILFIRQATQPRPCSISSPAVLVTSSPCTAFPTYCFGNGGCILVVKGPIGGGIPENSVFTVTYTGNRNSFNAYIQRYSHMGNSKRRAEVPSPVRKSIFNQQAISITFTPQALRSPLISFSSTPCLHQHACQKLRLLLLPVFILLLFTPAGMSLNLVP